MKRKVRYFKGGAIKEMDDRYAIVLVKLNLVEYVEEKVETVINQSPVTKVINQGNKQAPFKTRNKQFKGE